MIARTLPALAAAFAVVATATPASAVTGCWARSSGTYGNGSCTFPAWSGTYVLHVTTTANYAWAWVSCDDGGELGVSTENGFNVVGGPLAGGTCTITVGTYGESPASEAVGHVQWTGPL